MASPVIIFKVILKDDENVWRRIAMKPNQTLDDLHEAIFSAFDRWEEHLYSFHFPKPGSRGLAKMGTAKEYTHPACADELDPWTEEPIADASETKLSELGLRANRKFFYQFDFGDEWWHEIIVETVIAPRKPGRYPRVIEKSGKSPPQYPRVDDDPDGDSGDGEVE